MLVLTRKKLAWSVVALCVCLLIILCVFLTTNLTTHDYTPVVYTNCGNVQGRQVYTSHNNTIDEFLYIPYAVPPLGARRWEHSALLSGEDCWEGTYLANNDSMIRCVQAGLPVRGVEDCLYLSVRTPSVVGSLPVLVWIHGGALQYGYAEQSGYSADSEFTADVGLVTVNINYRLDVLGFLSVPELWSDGKSYGNFGIHDAIVALEWVQANIREFGGDPERVTIMGESGGATAALGIIASPKGDGLFSKAIALSPAPFWNATYTEAYAKRRDYLSKIGCGPDEYDDLEDRRACLKNTSVDVLVENVDLNRGWGFYDFPMSNGTEGESIDYNVVEPFVIPYSPADIPTRSTTNRAVQVILSNTAQEVAYWTFISEHNVFDNWTIVEETLSDRLIKFSGDDALLDDIKSEYMFGADSAEWWPQLAWDTLITDIRETCPTNKLTEGLSLSPLHDTYRLYIKHRPSEAVGVGWDSWHGWDTEAMFNFKYYNFETLPHDHALKTQLRALVRDFCHGHTSHWSKTIIIGNSEPWTRYQTGMPQSTLCSFWDSHGFEGWGWQN